MKQRERRGKKGEETRGEGTRRAEETRRGDTEKRGEKRRGGKIGSKKGK